MKRRRFLRTATAAAGVWTLGGAAGACTSTTDSERRVAELRSRFFSGPIRAEIDLETLNPKRRPDSTQIGACADFQHMDEVLRKRSDEMLSFAVAAGIKWLRTGHRVEDWDWRSRRPKDFLEHYIEAEAALGIRPLLHTNADRYIGTPQHGERWLQVARAGLDRWGDKIGALQFGNEPHIPWGRVYGGEYWGGPWLTRYSRFVESVSWQIKRKYPKIKLINGAHLPGVALTQLGRSMPALDGVDWHHYSFMNRLPPENTSVTKDEKFPTPTSASVKIEEVARDYLTRARSLGRNSALQLWMTETGIPTALPGYDTPHDMLAPLDDQHQAKWMARMLTMALMNSSKVFIYHLWDQGANRPAKVANYGLVTRALQPKPAFFVLGRISALTHGRATLDPAFHASVIDLEVDDRYPLFERIVGSSRPPESQIFVREEVRVVRFIRGDGKALLAIWSTYPILPSFRPRRATFEVNTPLGARPIVVDPITGASRELRDHRITGPGNREQFDLTVWNYPQFVMLDK